MVDRGRALILTLSDSFTGVGGWKRKQRMEEGEKISKVWVFTPLI